MEVVRIPFGYEQLPDSSDPHRFRGCADPRFDHRVDKISIPVVDADLSVLIWKGTSEYRTVCGQIAPITDPYFANSPTVRYNSG